MFSYMISCSLDVRNCDCRIAGNVSSIYLTLVALYNLSKGSFYYCDEIVNTFLEKMERRLADKVTRHEEQLVRCVLGSPVPARILLHILLDKFRRSSSRVVSQEPLTETKVEELLRHIVKQKFELRVASGDLYDDYMLYLSGEQKSQMEISYTKQQQKQKQTQKNKNQDSDAMGVFDKKNQLSLAFGTENYFDLTLTPEEDLTKISLNLPAHVPILTVSYEVDGNQRTINVYPTLQFLYSHHIHGSYISKEVQDIFKSYTGNILEFFDRFLGASVEQAKTEPPNQDDAAATCVCDGIGDQLEVKVLVSGIKQSPQYTIAALQQGVYIIGMKDQFNIHDMQSYPIADRIQYIADDMGFILYDKTATKRVDMFGPYFVEQYIRRSSLFVRNVVLPIVHCLTISTFPSVMEVLSKQEVAQNVIEYFCDRRDKLQSGLDTYGEGQGKGFVCWRFLMNETAKTAAAAAAEDAASGKRCSSSEESDHCLPGVVASKKRRSDRDMSKNTDADADQVADGFAKSLGI